MPAGKQPMQVVPAGRGLAWLMGALVLIRRQPARLLLIGLILQFLVGFSQFPLLALVLILVIPALSAGMMQVMLVVDRGARPPLATLLAAFSSDGRLLRLLMLGALMLAIMAVASGSVAALDPDLVARLEAGDISAIESLDPALIQRLIIAMLIGLIVSGSISYFAVPLVWFQDLKLGLAIGNGLLGMIRNWRPFLVLGLLVALLAVPAGLLTGILLAAAATGSAISPVFTVLMLLVAVTYQLILFGAQYASFREVFGVHVPDGGPPEEEGQLVA